MNTCTIFMEAIVQFLHAVNMTHYPACNGLRLTSCHLVLSPAGLVMDEWVSSACGKVYYSDQSDAWFDSCVEWKKKKKNNDHLVVHFGWWQDWKILCTPDPCLQYTFQMHSAHPMGQYHQALQDTLVMMQFTLKHWENSPHHYTITNIINIHILIPSPIW